MLNANKQADLTARIKKIWDQNGIEVSLVAELDRVVTEIEQLAMTRRQSNAIPNFGTAERTLNGRCFFSVIDTLRCAICYTQAPPHPAQKTLFRLDS
jgi:hypothetical protein